MMRHIVVSIAILSLTACGISQPMEAPEEPALAQQSSALCSVSYVCSGSQTLFCSGNTTCTSNPGYVLCDGTYTYCPCMINGVTYANGTGNPTNECQICDVTRSTTSW